MTQTMYGMVGGIIAFIFMFSRITDLGLTNSLAPYFKAATENKSSFKKIIFKYFLPIHIPIQLIALAFTPLIFESYLKIDLPFPLFLLISVLIILETFRSFARLYLHTAFKSKIVVSIELLSFSIFLVGVWYPLLFLNTQPSIPSILIPLLADSLFSLTFLTIAIIKFSYLKLPNTTPTPQPKLMQRILKNRFINATLRLSREIFTSNFLTPFFALTFSFQQAGIFFFASSISYSLQAIFRGTMNYPGAAMLATLKDAGQQEKKEAFKLLCKKLTLFIAPIIIFCTINSPFFIKMGTSLNLTQNITSIIALFLAITLSEFFFILYEQFYIVEEASEKFLLFKAIEFILFFIFVIKFPQTSIIQTLITIIAIRLLSFIIIASNAYCNWKISPVLKSTKTELAIYILVSAVAYVILSKLT
jgi:O-antigen/teichoic acid export membrane protein